MQNQKTNWRRRSLRTWQAGLVYWRQKPFIIEALSGLGLLVLAVILNQFANFYIASFAGTYVTDIFLDNLPIIDVHLIFSEGAVLFTFVLAAILLYRPQFIPFSLKCIALFVAVRSFFLVLTHLAPPPSQIYIDPTDFVNLLSSGRDLFFSAHTGLPFMFAFIYWNQRGLRYFFFICAVVGGATVLLGHLHYSIDVFSALFISFGVYHLCKNLFPKDYFTAMQ